MIKNQFYSTLRRQQRKINRLLCSKEFESLIGGKLGEISSDELYKFIKDGKLDYDDIKGIYDEVLTWISSEKFKEYKEESIEEVKIERESEDKRSRLNRRSYRLSKKRTNSESEEYDLTQVGILVLFKILRNYRIINKDKLPQKDSLSSGESSREGFKRNSAKRKEVTNKRVAKEKSRKEDSENSDPSARHSKFEAKYSNIANKGLVPHQHEELFLKMKDSEEDYTPPKGIKFDDYKEDLEKQIESLKNLRGQEEVREFDLRNSSERKTISILKETSHKEFSKQKVFPEESDPNGYCSQYLNVTISPNKKLDFQEGEREHSINSNLSHGFGYNHEDFPSFGNKNMMNLSKPIDVNFDSFNMVPNMSNYAYNMMNKMTDSLKMHQKNISLNLNFSNAEFNMQPE
jgi:hypothetical protein